MTRSTTTFDHYIGVHYEEDGDYDCRIDTQAHHLNPTGNINGGVFLSLADNISTGAAGDAYQKKYGEHKFMVGIDLHATMMGNQSGGTIRARCEVIRTGRRVSVVCTRILGDNDRLLAQITTTHVPID